MKIRCEHNSLRLRLRKSELVQLRAERWLETSVHFPGGGVLAWELALEQDIRDIGVVFAAGRLRISIPADVAFRWMDSAEVGMENYLALGDGNALHILMEKNFPCKDRPEEDKSDFFAELTEDAPLKC